MPNGKLKCSALGTCPQGYACLSGACWRNGTGPSGPGDDGGGGDDGGMSMPGELGASCSDNSECLGGHCTDGTCCNEGADTCTGCRFNNDTDCEEGFYGVRLYRDRDGRYQVGVCIQRMDLCRPLDEFLNSGLPDEIRQLRQLDFARLTATARR